MRNLTKLEELWLNGNPISGLPAAIEACRCLAFVNLEHTNIHVLPPELSRVEGLVHVALSPQALKPKLAGAYASGTKRLMEYLAKKDEKRGLRAALVQRLRLDVYREAALTERGTAQIEALASSILKQFASLDDVVLVTRNLERLLSPSLDAASAVDAAARLVSLRRENTVKKLAADLELKLRALYFDVVRPERVEGIIKGIYEHVRELEDVRFLLHFAKDLFPKDPDAIDGRVLLRDLQVRPLPACAALHRRVGPHPGVCVRVCVCVCVCAELARKAKGGGGCGGCRPWQGTQVVVPRRGASGC